MLLHRKNRGEFMTLDEAIEQFKYDAECNRADLDLSYAEDNEQVAEWLEELKHIKQWKSDVMDGFCKYDASSFEELITNARNKAIDDFVKKISESNQGHWRVTRYEHGEAVSETMSYDIGTIRLIAEQLKAGITND